MNSITKAYLLTVMLALSTVSFGLGGVVDDAEAQDIKEDDECRGEGSMCIVVEDSSEVIGLASDVVRDEDDDVPIVGDDGAPIFPDDGHDGDDEDDLQVVIPGTEDPPLSYQDTDGDGYSDFEELSGCGTGVPINPFNPDAHCDNYDGDSLDNDEDPNPFTPDDLLILDLVKQEDVASADPFVLEYQCYSGTTEFKFTFELVPHGNTSAGNNNGRINGIGLGPDYDAVTVEASHLANASGEDDPDDVCYEDGLATFDPDILRLTVENAKGDHDDGVFRITMTGDNDDTSGPVESNQVELTLTNAAEEGTWTPTCLLNKTSGGYSNGYCGEPDDTATVNGVEITYDANGFPDKHPHPSVDIEYEVEWTFNHTSYLTDDGHDLTQISIENHLTDADCDDGDTINRITFGEPSQGCDRDANRTDVFTFDGPNGTDSAGNPFYTMRTSYLVHATGSGAPGEGDGRTGHNQYLVAEVIDRGGTRTYWGEGVDGDGDPIDDHDKFTHFMPQYSRVNQAPLFSYVDDPSKPSHDNTSEPYVVHDRGEAGEEGEVLLRVILHDDRAYGDVGSPGDDLSLTLRYAISDDKTTPDEEDFIEVHQVGLATNSCKGLGIPFLDTCEFEDDGDSDSGGEDAIDDRVDGNTANSEAFEQSVSVADGKVIHYTWNVTDSDGAAEEYGTIFTYVVGELPLDDPPVSTLAGSGLDEDVQGLVDTIDGAIEESADALVGDEDSGDTGDPWDLDEDGITNEPNGQVDVVERFGYYIDTDAGSGRDAEHFDKFDGYDGADGVSLHLAPTGGIGIEEADHPVVRVGDVAGSDLFELAVLTDGFDTLCVVENPGQYDVSLYMGGAYKSDAEDPCGDELTSDQTLKAVQISNDGFTGIIVYDDVDNDDERDGAEERRSNFEAASCEDVLIVAINTDGDPSLSEVRLLAADPYPQDPCEDGDGGDDGPLGDDSDGDGVPDTVDDEVPEEGATDDSDGDGVPDVVDDEVPDEGATDDSDGDGIPDVVDDEVPDEDPFDGLCFRGTPIGSVGICYSEKSDVYVVVIGPISGPVIPL